MISRLYGEVVEKTLNFLVIDVGGVGYQVFCTPGTSAKHRLGEKAIIHTTMVVREDAIVLYGFADKVERETFELVQTASGVGAKTALAVLATMSPEKFVSAVASEDEKAITAVPGIGRKGAQRIILELKDKVARLGVEPLTDADGVSSDWRIQVSAALVSLGYSASVAEAACDNVSELAATEASISDLLKAALQSLAK